MKNAETMAYINLHSVLRNIEDLCRLDHESTKLIEGQNLAIRFIVKGGPSATLVFKDNKCKMVRNKVRSTITLYFTSINHFNKMVDGEAMPIPLKGVHKIGFLTGAFMKLTERLEFFLRPDPIQLEDENFKRIHTELLFYTAAFALTAIGNVDPIGKQVAKSIPDGIISMEIGNGPCVAIKASAGSLETRKGLAKSPRAKMAFGDMEAAFALLSGQVDSYTMIAQEKLSLSGFIPMLDNLDKLLFSVSAYLS